MFEAIQNLLDHPEQFDNLQEFILLLFFQL